MVDLNVSILLSLNQVHQIIKNALFISCLINAIEGHRVAITDIPGAFLSADWPLSAPPCYLRFEGVMVDMICELIPEYKDLNRYLGKWDKFRQRKRWLIGKVTKAIYGTLLGAIISGSNTQSITTRSSTQADLVGIDGAIGFVEWTSLFCKFQVKDYPENHPLKKLGTKNMVKQDNTSTIKMAKGEGEHVENEPDALRLGIFILLKRSTKASL